MTAQAEEQAVFCRGLSSRRIYALMGPQNAPYIIPICTAIIVGGIAWLVWPRSAWGLTFVGGLDAHGPEQPRDYRHQPRTTSGPPAGSRSWRRRSLRHGSESVSWRQAPPVRAGQVREVRRSKCRRAAELERGEPGDQLQWATVQPEWWLIVMARWRVDYIGKGGKHLGTVEATDEASAIAKAMQTFHITIQSELRSACSRPTG